MTSLQLFGTMEVQAIHMKPQSSGMTGLMEGDEDLMSKAWSTTPLPMCPKCKSYNNINPVFSGTPGTKLKEMMDRTKLVKHVPGAKPHEIGFCQTCKSLVPSNGELRPMYTQLKYKYLSYQPMSPERAKAQVHKAAEAVTQFMADFKQEEAHAKEVGHSSAQPTVINMKLLE